MKKHSGITRIATLAAAFAAGTAQAAEDIFEMPLESLMEMRVSAVLIANFGAVMNDLIAFGDGIQRDDGLLNACVYSPRNVADAARILLQMTFRRFTPDPCIIYRSGSSFMIETDPPRLGQADGELIGDSPFSVHVEPLAARVLVPGGR